MDVVAGQGPCGCWVEKECASMLLQHLQLGFELDVYAPEEYCMLFWCAPTLILLIQGLTTTHSQTKSCSDTPLLQSWAATHYLAVQNLVGTWANP